VTNAHPRSIGALVPKARIPKKSSVFPGKAYAETVEKRNAERPMPEMTIPVAVAR